MVKITTQGLITTLALTATLFFAASHGSAASFNVTTTVDTVDGICDSHCSLREAVVAANETPGRDRITVPSGTYVLEIAGRGEDRAQRGDLDIRETVVIRGAGRDMTIIDGGGIDRVFHVLPPRPNEPLVEIEDLSIIGGQAAGGDDGGGLLNTGSLALWQVTLSRNEAIGSCGNGGGIANGSGTLALEQVWIAENTSSCAGGGLWNRFGTVSVNLSQIRSNRATGCGGGMYTDAGTVSMQRSTIADNLAEGDRARGGGVWAGASTVLLKQSTVSGNLITGSGRSSGAGVWADVATMTLHNCTFSGNRSSGSGGSEGGGLASRLSTVVIGSTTFSTNSAAEGSAVWSENSTITATNTLADGGCDLSLPLFSGGGNMESPGDTCRFNAPSDHPSTPRSALRLGPLGDNGGPTQTHPLLPGSAAVDSGSDWVCPARDQRGESRPVDGTGDGRAVCDVGAFEARPGGELIFTTWLPIAARTDGANGARWRTDMAVLNASQGDTDLELVFHGDDVAAEHDAVLPRSAQVVFHDVVATLGLDNATGVVEVRSSQPVVVSSRTANHTHSGTLGQFVGGVTIDQGLEAGEVALLPQLSEDASTNTNLVLSNTGHMDANLEIRLYDDFGWKLADISMAVPAQRVHLVHRLFIAAVGSGGSGWAEVELIEGQGLIAFASLVDRRSGDATTIPMVIQGR